MSRFQKVVAQRVNQLSEFPFWKEKKTNDEKNKRRINTKARMISIYKKKQSVPAKYMIFSDC